MAGIYNRLDQDPAFELAQDYMNNGIYQYTLFRPAVMPVGVSQAPNLQPVQNQSFHGPLAGRRVTQESFLQGRGHTLSKAPGNDVIYLPQSVFSTDPKAIPDCSNVSMMAQHSRLKSSCSGVREMDTSQYALSPGKWQGDYAGVNSIVQTNLQTRMGPVYNPHALANCAQNYGSAAPQRKLQRYM